MATTAPLPALLPFGRLRPHYRVHLCLLFRAEVKCPTPLPSSRAPVLIQDVSPFANPGYTFSPGSDTLKNRASTYPLDGLSKSVWSMEVVKGSARLYAMVLSGTPASLAPQACKGEWRTFC